MKSFDEIEVLIWRNPDELSEPEIEGYLQIAEVQTTLDLNNFMALMALDGSVEAEDAA